MRTRGPVDPVAHLPRPSRPRTPWLAYHMSPITKLTLVIAIITTTQAR